MVGKIPVGGVLESARVAIKKRELRATIMQICVDETWRPHTRDVLRVEQPYHQGWGGYGAELHLVIVGSRSVELLVETIMEQIEPATAPRVTGANPNTTARLDRGIGAPRHLVIGWDSEGLGQIEMPAVSELLGCGGVAKTFPGQKVVILENIELGGEAPLFEVVQAISSLGVLLGPMQRRQQQAGQDRDNRNHHQQLYQRKSFQPLHEPCQPR